MFSEPMKNFFLSLKTTVWTLLAMIGLFFIGAYMMPVHRDVFGPMNDLLLFQWIERIAAGNPWQTWWFFASIAALVLLTINTIVCSIQAVIGRWSRRNFLLRIAPQVIHIGFLFILLAHLLGAGWGYRLSGFMPQGTLAQGLPEGRALHLVEVRVDVSDAGFPTDWSASVVLYEKGVNVKAGVLGPNRPLFYKGMGVYLKNIDFRRGPAAILMVNRDPGAIWALVGGILFMLGSTVLLVLKLKET